MITYGRSSSCDVVVEDDACSARHASTSSTPSGLELRDLGSTNGTFVNGTRIHVAIINNGDQVRLGTTEFLVKSGHLELAPAAPQRSKVRTTLPVVSALIAAAVATVVIVVAVAGRDDDPGSSETTSTALTRATEARQGSEVDLFSPPQALGDLVTRASQSVISIDCGNGSGSGWPIQVGDEVLIVSNHHVVEECVRSGVTFSTLSRRGRASVVAADRDTDLALLRPSSTLTPLKTAPPPPIGAWLMIAGSPLGLERSVSYGTLNNIVEGWLITDAAINPGNSGGPVFDSTGNVVGIAQAKLVDADIDRVGIVIAVAELCVAVLECDSTFPG